MEIFEAFIGKTFVNKYNEGIYNKNKHCYYLVDPKDKRIATYTYIKETPTNTRFLMLVFVSVENYPSIGAGKIGSLLNIYSDGSHCVRLQCSR